MSTRRFLLAAAFAAMAFTFLACSSDEPDDGEGKGNNIENYETTVIGNQTWMAENLNYAVEGSKCYGEGEVIIGWEDDERTPITTKLLPSEVQANCTKYGRLYDWATAMKLPSSCNSNLCADQIQPKHQGICPDGWHIPSDADWNALMTTVGGKDIAGTKLKAKSGWNWNDDDNISGNGTDNFDFSALPGGAGNSYFARAGFSGYWWSANEYDNTIAYNIAIRHLYEHASWYDSDKNELLSVRCMKD